MKILGLDFETTGEDPSTCYITEVGAILTSDSKNAPREIFSQLCLIPGQTKQTPEVIEITGITDEMLTQEGKDTKEVLTELLAMLDQADLVMAHNAQFDRKVLAVWCEKLGLNYNPFPTWICTYQDVPYPRKYKCKKLSHLALDHGVKMDGRNLHRASEDVALMLELVLGHYSIDEIVSYAKEPWVYLRARILGPWNGPGGDGGVGKNQASKLGYSWETVRRGPERSFPKSWVKAVKAREVDEERKLAPFGVELLIT